MKKRMIYNEASEMNDMSKDRVHLNLSYEEWKKLKSIISIGTRYIEDEKWAKKGKNIRTMFAHCQELHPIWDKTNKEELEK